MHLRPVSASGCSHWHCRCAASMHATMPRVGARSAGGLDRSRTLRGRSARSCSTSLAPRRPADPVGPWTRRRRSAACRRFDQHHRRPLPAVRGRPIARWRSATFARLVGCPSVGGPGWLRGWWRPAATFESFARVDPRSRRCDKSPTAPKNQGDECGRIRRELRHRPPAPTTSRYCAAPPRSPLIDMWMPRCTRSSGSRARAVAPHQLDLQVVQRIEVGEAVLDRARQRRVAGQPLASRR